MKTSVLVAAIMLSWPVHLGASTIMVVPVFEPLSLHGTDGDEAVSDTGEGLQANVMSRPMALSGANPEMLVEAIRTAHLIPTNNPNYTVKETNLLVLANVGISCEMKPEGLMARLDVSQLAIPLDVDLTARQILKLCIVAVKRTLEEYQKEQTENLPVSILIDGATEGKSGLKDLAVTFTIKGSGIPAN